MTFTSKFTAAVGLSLAAMTFSPREATPGGPNAENGLPVPANTAKADKEFQKAVDLAIERGVEWLKFQQRSDGSWFKSVSHAESSTHLGQQALVLLALAKCGMTPSDKEISRGLKVLDMVLESTVGSKLENAKSYDMAFTVLCYQALYEKNIRPKEKARVKQIVQWFEKSQENNIWRYPSPDHSEDLSVTQCVLLALEMASHLGITAKPETYQKALQYLLREQEQTGPEVTLLTATKDWKAGSTEGLYGTKIQARGFGYGATSKSGVKGSMTAGGVSSLAIIKSQLMQLKGLKPGQERALDNAILSGLAWLGEGENFSVERNPTATKSDVVWRNYYFYAIERAVMLLGIPNLGVHDPLREISVKLISDQKSDGSWSSSELLDAQIDTCLALLVLRRGTTPPVVSVLPKVTTDSDSTHVAK